MAKQQTDTAKRRCIPLIPLISVTGRTTRCYTSDLLQALIYSLNESYEYRWGEYLNLTFNKDDCTVWHVEIE
jgi:hypothetical protein